VDPATERVNAALTRAMDNGGMAILLARVTAEERGWPKEVRERLAEEFLFETVDKDNEAKGFNALDNNNDNSKSVKAQVIMKEEEELQAATKDNKAARRWWLRYRQPWRKRRSYRRSQRTMR